MAAREISVDVVIFGGGAAGLWLLDDLHRAGYCTLLLEKHALGSGQTVASQGIIHGGLKYALSGKFTRSADAVKSLPTRWRQCLEGRATPDLRLTRLRSMHCHLWSTESLRSMLGMFAASHALTVRPTSIYRDEWPEALKQIRGNVMKLNEQVISPQSFIAELASQHHDRLLKLTDRMSFRFSTTPAGVMAINLDDPDRSHALCINTDHVVFAAGEGNQYLRELAGLPAEAMQRRPVQMILARGPLPPLTGHCIDGRRTRVTITTDRDSQGRIVWQIGGQVSEDGVGMSREELVMHTIKELQSTIPGITLDGVEWTTYTVNKAEGKQKGGRRPVGEVVLHENNVFTVWPTKLVLAPAASQRVMHLLPDARTTPGQRQIVYDQLADWPRPDVASPPWETAEQWISVNSATRV